MNFRPASSMLRPSDAILMRDSVSGTCVMQTREFKTRPPGAQDCRGEGRRILGKSPDSRKERHELGNHLRRDSKRPFDVSPSGKFISKATDAIEWPVAGKIAPIRRKAEERWPYQTAVTSLPARTGSSEGPEQDDSIPICRIPT